MGCTEGVSLRACLCARVKLGHHLQGAGVGAPARCACAHAKRGHHQATLGLAAAGRRGVAVGRHNVSVCGQRSASLPGSTAALGPYLANTKPRGGPAHRSALIRLVRAHRRRGRRGRGQRRGLDSVRLVRRHILKEFRLVVLAGERCHRATTTATTVRRRLPLRHANLAHLIILTHGNHGHPMCHNHGTWWRRGRCVGGEAVVSE